MSSDVFPNIIANIIAIKCKWENCIFIRQCLFNFQVPTDDIKKLTKQSLRKRLAEFLSQDWLHEDKAHHFSLQKYYVQLEWVRKVKEATSVEMKDMSGLDELIAMGEDEPGTILVEGNQIKWNLQGCLSGGPKHPNFRGPISHFSEKLESP